MNTQTIFADDNSLLLSDFQQQYLNIRMKYKKERNATTTWLITSIVLMLAVFMLSAFVSDYRGMEILCYIGIILAFIVCIVATIHSIVKQKKAYQEMENHPGKIIIKNQNY